LPQSNGRWAKVARLSGPITVSGKNFFALSFNLFASYIKPKMMKIFEQSIISREGKPTFTFYEGPPSANGTPGIHHVMARTVKDIFCVANTPSTAASRILANFTAPYTATPVKRMEEAGGVMLGKVNLDEFTYGSSNESSAFQPASRNPWDTTRVPGGSSGGSAAAVAAFEGSLSLGTDTAGSIRQPASFCGVVGMKPTYGRVSRYGLIAFGSSLDCPGPLAHQCPLIAHSPVLVGRH